MFVDAFLVHHTISIPDWLVFLVESDYFAIRNVVLYDLRRFHLCVHQLHGVASSNGGCMTRNKAASMQQANRSSVTAV